MSLHDEDLNTIETEIGGKIGNSKVRSYITKIAGDGETISATLLGMGEKTSIGAIFGTKAGASLGGNYLVLTDRRVILIKSGIGTWGTGAFGLKTKSVLFEHISSVDTSSGLMFGEIEIIASGMTEKAGGGFFGGATKDSVIQFDKTLFDQVEQLAAKIRNLAISSRSGQPQVVTADIPDQIKKLADLRDAGILTEDEFHKIKSDLLEKL